jgi:hypothetical protein
LIVQHHPNARLASFTLGAGRCELLSRQLPVAVDWLRQRRDIVPGSFHDFDTLGSMTWHNAALELTPAGQTVHGLAVATGSKP